MVLRNGEPGTAGDPSPRSVRRLISCSRFSKKQIVGRRSFIKPSAFSHITATWLIMLTRVADTLYQSRAGFFPVAKISPRHFGRNKLRISAFGLPCLQTD